MKSRVLFFIQHPYFSSSYPLTPNSTPAFVPCSRKILFKPDISLEGLLSFKWKPCFFLFVFFAFSSTEDPDLFEYENVVACSFTCWPSWPSKSLLHADVQCFPCGSDYYWSLPTSSHFGTHACQEFFTLCCWNNRFRGQPWSWPLSSLWLSFANLGLSLSLCS